MPFFHVRDLSLVPKGSAKTIFLWSIMFTQSIVPKDLQAKGKAYSVTGKKSSGKAYSPRAARPSPMVVMIPEQWLLRLSTSLDTIKTLSADISQRNPNGTMMGAKFYLERPGKMRLVYNPPSKMQIIATQGKLIHYDGQRDYSQSMALSQSPVAFLLTGKLHEQVTLVEMVETPQTITLGMKLKKDPKAGKIELTFHRPTMLQHPHLCPLMGWAMRDAYGKTTTITLRNVVKNGLIPKGAFELQKK